MDISGKGKGKKYKQMSNNSTKKILTLLILPYLSNMMVVRTMTMEIMWNNALCKALGMYSLQNMSCISKEKNPEKQNSCRIQKSYFCVHIQRK